jgi:predicted nucleotidyltransferase
MFERWLEVLREVLRAREEEARRLIEELCREALVVALFGSRARGDYTPLSDWDLLAVVEGGGYKWNTEGSARWSGCRWISLTRSWSGQWWC